MAKRSSHIGQIMNLTKKDPPWFCKTRLPLHMEVAKVDLFYLNDYSLVMMIHWEEHEKVHYGRDKPGTCHKRWQIRPRIGWKGTLNLMIWYHPWFLNYLIWLMCWDVIYNLQIDVSLSSNLLDCGFHLQINWEGIIRITSLSHKTITDIIFIYTNHNQ